MARARTLVVADRVSDAHPLSLPAWPFYSGAGLNSATWLNDALHAIGFDETRAIWTNVNHPDEHVLSLLRAHPYLNVVALGREAEKGLARLGVTPTSVLPHPQWARRFQFHEPKTYRDQLRGAIT